MSTSDHKTTDVSVFRKSLDDVIERIKVHNKGKKSYILTLSFADSELVLDTPKVTKAVAGFGRQLLRYKCLSRCW